jgi:hypothetical protein
MFTRASIPFLLEVYGECIKGTFNYYSYDEMAMNAHLWKHGANQHAIMFDPWAGFVDSYFNQTTPPYPSFLDHRSPIMSFLWVHGCKNPVDARALFEKMKANAHLPVHFVRGKWRREIPISDFVITWEVLYPDPTNGNVAFKTVSPSFVYSD